MIGVLLEGSSVQYLNLKIVISNFITLRIILQLVKAKQRRSVILLKEDSFVDVD